VLPGIQRRPQAFSTSRIDGRSVVLGPRGRRLTVIEGDGATWDRMLPLDLVGEDVGIDDAVSPPQLVVSCPRQGVLVRTPMTPDGPDELSREALDPGRAAIESLPAGGLELLDGLLRPDPGEPSVRGLAGPSGRRYRAVRRDALAGIVGTGEGGRRMAMLARIPKADAVQVLGLDPAAEGDSLDRGWLAAWTGEDATRRLHFVRFDAEGRVLWTTPAPPGTPSPPPEGFDLRAGISGPRDLLVALPSEQGLAVWRYVPGEDGTWLRIELTPGSEGSSPPG
jgi:hypothetical protein